MAQQKYRLAYLQHNNRSPVYVDNGTRCFYTVKSATSTRLVRRRRADFLMHIYHLVRTSEASLPGLLKRRFSLIKKLLLTECRAFI